MSEDERNYDDDNRKWPAWWIVFPVLFGITLIACGYMYYKYYSGNFDSNGKSYETQYQEIVTKYNTEKAELNRQLDEIKAQLDLAIKNNGSLSTENASLKEQLDNKTLEIARKIKNGGAGNPKALLEAKAELEKLKGLQKILQYSNDSLSSSNRDLIARLMAAESNVEEANTRARTFEEQKTALDEKVKNSTLSVADLRVVGVRTKGSTEEETFKAGRVTQLKIMFSILENELIEAGDKDITVRIIGTASEVLTNENPTLTDTDKLVTMVKTVTYNNELLKSTFYYSQKAAYKKGNYSIELFHKDKLMGRAVFSLK